MSAKSEVKPTRSFNRTHSSCTSTCPRESSPPWVDQSADQSWRDFFQYVGKTHQMSVERDSNEGRVRECSGSLLTLLGWVPTSHAVAAVEVRSSQNLQKGNSIPVISAWKRAGLRSQATDLVGESDLVDEDDRAPRAEHHLCHGTMRLVQIMEEGHHLTRHCSGEKTRWTFQNVREASPM